MECEPTRPQCGPTPPILPTARPCIAEHGLHDPSTPATATATSSGTRSLLSPCSELHLVNPVDRTLRHLLYKAQTKSKDHLMSHAKVDRDLYFNGYLCACTLLSGVKSSCELRAFGFDGEGGYGLYGEWGQLGKSPSSSSSSPIFLVAVFRPRF